MGEVEWSSEPEYKTWRPGQNSNLETQREIWICGIYCHLVTLKVTKDKNMYEDGAME